MNRSWLETGEGYPGDLTVDLVKAHYEDKIKRNERVIDNLIGRIEELEKQLGPLKKQAENAKEFLNQETLLFLQF